MSEGLHLRRATDDDLPAILAIYNHAIEKTTAVFEYRPHTLDMRREWLKAKAAADFPVLVAIDGGEVVGFAAYGPFRAWPGYKYSVEHSVYVAEGSRRRGVGRALVSGIVAEARRHAMHTIIGGVVSDNVASLRLHEALGFVEVGRIREVGFKFSRWLDLVFLQLVLDTPADPIDG